MEVTESNHKGMFVGEQWPTLGLGVREELLP